MENVRSMFSHKSGHLLKLIIRTIVAMGYQVAVSKKKLI
jgi:site-specific DNA-cytosine methylase